MLFHDNAQLVPGNRTLGTPDKVIHWYDITNIEKYSGLKYEDGADRIATIMSNPQLRLNTDLLVDGTGIGDAVVELLRTRKIYPIPIIFSGGETAREHHTDFGKIFEVSSKNNLSGAKVLENISVPKKDLVNSGQIMLQQGRLRVAPGRWKDELKNQLNKFRAKFNDKTKYTKYEAETEQIHDDLVVIFLMGSWWILNRKEKGIPEQTADQNATTGWNPMDYC